MRTLAKLAEQLPIILEEHPENFRHAENILPVGNRIEDIRLEVRTELYHLLGVTGGAGKRGTRLRNQRPRQLKASRYS